jgi:tRNA nucleotidyltransferase (CCA-adding enzyme)
MAARLRQVNALRAVLPELAAGPPASRVVRLLENYDTPALRAAWVAADEPAARAAIAGYLTRLRHITPRADGDTLRQLGLRPGPHFGEILAALRDAWLDGAVTDEAGERRLLEELIAGQDTHHAIRAT